VVVHTIINGLTKYKIDDKKRQVFKETVMVFKPTTQLPDPHVMWDQLHLRVEPAVNVHGQKYQVGMPVKGIMFVNFNSWEFHDVPFHQYVMVMKEGVPFIR
jgi:hypothetical protein